MVPHLKMEQSLLLDFGDLTRQTILVTVKDKATKQKGLVD